MESNLWACRHHQEDEENLLANVVSLRSRLRKTERNLQHLGEELFSTSSYDSSDHSIRESEFESLTMEDLVHPSEFQKSSTHIRMSWQDSDSPRKSRHKSYSISFDKSMEEENEELREKLNIIREQNASLTSQNHHLMNDIETIKFELNQSRARISFLESALGTHSVSIPMLEDQIASLEAEVQAQNSVLKEAENKLDQSQQMIMEKEYTLQKFKEEYKKMKLDLTERTKQGKRAEQQRNEALSNAEELTRTFKKYKEKITEQIEKVQDEEQILEKKLNTCVKEKEKLHAKCDTYRSEFENMKEQLRRMAEDNSLGKENLKCVEAKSSEMESLLRNSQQKVLTLERKLQDQDQILEEKKSLTKENTALKTLIAQQNDHLKSCHQEIENSQIELTTLENVISQLSQSSSKEHYCKATSCATCCESNGALIEDLRRKLALKEAEIQKLQVDLVASKLAQDLSAESEGQGCGRLHGLETEPVKLTGGKTERKHQQLELVSKQFEKEKRRLIRQLEELHTKLAKCEDENSSLRANMAQRTTQFQAIQEELLEKAAKSSGLEREAARKSSQLSTLEKQLEEKTITLTAAVARNTELEQELAEVSSQLRNLEKSISDEQEHFTITLEKSRLIHLEQHNEMEKQIESFQTQLQTKTQQFLEQEKTMSILQQDILGKQRQLESLDRLLTERKEEMEKQNTKKDEALKMLQEQLSEETMKVRQLQTALDIYREDLQLYLSQLEENKVSFEKQLKKNSEEVQLLQKELKLKDDNLQATAEQNLLLQQTLQQQQQMLHQETLRNGELEESQAKLQKQVLKLEQELQSQKESLEENLRRMKEKLHLASEETDLKRQKVAELTGTIRQIKMEMDQCKDELIDMEKELVHLRRDSHSKAVQLGHLDMTLEQKNLEMQQRIKQVKELEDKLLWSETQHKDAVQKNKVLETELLNARGELKNTLRQLQDLRDMLQSAQMSLEEKYAAIQDLTDELRDCKDELEDKRQELLNMEQAMEERNWELKQRAAQVTQLDMTIREHRGEMEQKIINLEGSLEKAELLIRERNKQIENLEIKLQQSKDQLRDREFDILQQDQELNRLKKEIQKKEQRIADIEKTVTEQEKCIADKYKEVLDLGQQLRLEREQMKHVHVELLDSRRQLAQTQRDVDRHSHELEEVIHLSNEKDARANHLAEQLGAAQARETQLEARMEAEVNTLSAEMHSLKESYKSEKLAHEAKQAKWQHSINQQVAKSHHLTGQVQQLKLELEDAQGTVCNLQQQLQSRNEIVQAASEALLLKESEVTRLQTRIAGHERTEGLKQLSIPQGLPLHQWFDDQELDFFKHSAVSYTKHRKLRRSTSASDLGAKGDGGLLDQKERFALGSSVTCKEQKETFHASPKSLNESSFDPLAYTEDEDVTCGSSDFHTLSGMLKYINNEMKNSENTSL